MQQTPDRRRTRISSRDPLVFLRIMGDAGERTTEDRRARTGVRGLLLLSAISILTLLSHSALGLSVAEIPKAKPISVEQKVARSIEHAQFAAIGRFNVAPARNSTMEAEMEAMLLERYPDSEFDPLLHPKQSSHFVFTPEQVLKGRVTPRRGIPLRLSTFGSASKDPYSESLFESFSQEFAMLERALAAGQFVYLSEYLVRNESIRRRALASSAIAVPYSFLVPTTFRGIDVPLKAGERYLFTWRANDSDGRKIFGYERPAAIDLYRMTGDDQVAVEAVLARQAAVATRARQRIAWVGLSLIVLVSMAAFLLRPPHH